MEHLTEAELQAWLDREIEPDERARVSRHLSDCDACRRVAGELRAMAERFSAAILQYDEDMAAESGGLRPLRELPVPRRVRSGLLSRLPRWAGRAAAIALLLGAAGAAAMVPGSPLRELVFGPPSEVIVPAPSPVDVRTGPVAVVDGASITVRPQEGRLTVRINDFAPGTRVVVGLVDRTVAVANLPDGARNARFVVAAGTLEVVGTGVPAGELDGVVRLGLPRSLEAGVVEIDGAIVARVRNGRMSTLRQVSRTGDEAVFEVGG